MIPGAARGKGVGGPGGGSAPLAVGEGAYLWFAGTGGAGVGRWAPGRQVAPDSVAVREGLF